MASANEIHREFVAAWNARDFDKFKSMLDPEYTYTGSDGKTIPGPDSGVAAAKVFASAFPDAQTEIKEMHGSGETSIGEFLTAGTQTGPMMGIPPTGKKVSVNRCNIIQIRGDKIYREREYMDMMTVLVELGIVTPPGADTQSASGKS